MRLKKILLFFLVIGVFSCSKEAKEITINGKIIGFSSENVEFTTPIDGKWFYGDKKSITPDSTGSFQIKLNIDAPSFVTIYIPRKAGGVLLVEPGKTYKLDFNFGDNEKKFIVSSEDEIAQNLYNSFPPPEFQISDVREFLADSIPSRISKKINTQKEKAISEFDQLLEKEKISKDFHELAVLDRKNYYLAIETTVAAILLNKKNIENDNSGLTEYTDFWNKRLDVSQINESDYVRSPWFYAFVDNFILYKQLSSGNFDRKQYDRAYKNGDRYKNDIVEAKKYFKGESLEYYVSSYIFFNCWQTKDNSKKLIEIYKYFKNEYPNSSYAQYLTASVQPIIDFHNKVSKSAINEKIKYVENYVNIDTFDELIKTQKGKKVFVDIWGTWCGPCKKEFQQKDKYAGLLKSKNITTLYICEGRNSKEKVWKEMIKFYDLEGQHLLANEKLVADIIDKFGNKGSFAYPWYLLVDENGIVVNSQASYPSKIEQFEKEINEDYVW